MGAGSFGTRHSNILDRGHKPQHPKIEALVALEDAMSVRRKALVTAMPEGVGGDTCAKIGSELPDSRILAVSGCGLRVGLGPFAEFPKIEDPNIVP